MSNDTISAYEQQRLANIARNAQYLTELGIDPTPRHLMRSKKTSSSRSTDVSSSSAKKRKTPPSSAEYDMTMIRRSSRVAALQPVNYTEVSIH